MWSVIWLFWLSFHYLPNDWLESLILARGLSPQSPGERVFMTFLVLFYYRQDAAKRQTAGIKFTHRPKIRFFAPQGRLFAPIHVKLGRTDEHVGPLGCAKFHLNRPRGVGMRPRKYQKFPLFGKESPRRGDGATPLTDFQNV